MYVPQSSDKPEGDTRLAKNKKVGNIYVHLGTTRHQIAPYPKDTGT
jgi:hypothetical protein